MAAAVIQFPRPQTQLLADYSTYQDKGWAVTPMYIEVGCVAVELTRYRRGSLSYRIVTLSQSGRGMFPPVVALPGGVK